jgi:hypothetical protein
MGKALHYKSMGIRDCSWVPYLRLGGFDNIKPGDFVTGRCKCSSDRTAAAGQPNSYNCIAWAAGIKDRWWWPDEDKINIDWPDSLPRRPNGKEGIEDFIKAFELPPLNYTRCDSSDIEEGFEKIAIYATSDEMPTHACRSTRDGVWTSKIGDGEDIEHATLEMLEGERKIAYGRIDGYGKAVAFLKRPFVQ